MIPRPIRRPPPHSPPHMPAAPPADAVPAPSFWRDLTLAHAANGLVGFLFAASGPLAIILATATRGGLSEAETASWVFGSLFLNGIVSILFCLKYRQPLVFFWTIPGTVLVAPALAEAQDEAAAAIEAARAARTRVVDLEAARTAAQAAADVANTQLAIAERELQASSEARAQLEQLRDEANRQLEEAQKAHGPRDFELELISQPVRVVVEDAPVSIDVDSEPAALPQGGDANLTVRLERKFGFDGGVELKLIAPEGLALDAPVTSIATDSDSGVIEVRTRPETQAGRHACALEASMQFNGVQITKRIPLGLNISPATQP